MPLECNAVFKGGGAKGIAYVGALEALEMWDVKCVEVAGSSAGAITATLVACGYTAAEVIELMPRRPRSDRFRPDVDGQVRYPLEFAEQ